MNKNERLRWLVWFAFINGVIASAVSFSNVPASNAFSGGWPSFFLPFALPAHLVSISLLIALIACPLFLMRRTRIPATLLLLLLFWAWIVAVVIDTRVFALYRFHLNGMVLSLMTSGALGENIAFSSTMWWIVGALLAGVLGLEAALAWALHRWVQAGVLFKSRYLLFGLIFVLVIGQSIYTLSDACSYVPVTSQLCYIPWARPLTVKGFLKRHGFKVAQAPQQAPALGHRGVLHYPKEEIRCTEGTRLNVVLLLVDSLRFDMLTRELMPHTWEFSRKCLNFENHYSAGNCTRFGVFGLLYGLPGSYWQTFLDDQRASVFIDEFVKQGYDLQILTSARLSNPEFDRTAFVHVKDRLEQAKGENAHVSDTKLAETFAARLRNREVREPFFSFLFMDAPHSFSHPADVAPFQPEWQSVNYMALSNSFDPTPFLNLYKNAVYFDDLMISKIIEALESGGYLDRTVLVISSDHGQEFNELKQNFWGHNSDFSRYQVKVPLVIYWPGRGFAEYSERTSHVDLVPTLMKEVLGCTNPFSSYSTGSSLFDLKERSVLQADSWASRGVLEPSRIVELRDLGNMQVFDEDYGSLPYAESDGKAVSESLEMMSRFYKP